MISDVAEDMKQENNANDLQTWDLSCRSAQKGTTSDLESEVYPKVLDLSCKNASMQKSTTTIGTNTTVCLSQDLPAHADEQYQLNLESNRESGLDAEKRSPFVSTVMMSPSSSGSSGQDSPRETKCDPPFYGSEISTLSLFGPFPPVPMGVPFLPPALHQSGIIKIPMAMSTPATSYTDTLSLSSKINNGTTLVEPNMAGPSAESEMLTPPDALKKIPRPFKAYSKNLFSLQSSVMINPILSHSSNQKYQEYRQKTLQAIRKENATNPKMRRKSKSPGLPTSTQDEKTAAYLERRKKNNEAAKRSRDARRAKEDELAMRTTYLEKENEHLKSRLTTAYSMLLQAGYQAHEIQGILF